MKKELNDYIIEILQDFSEINSFLKIMKDSVDNDNSGIDKSDISNSLEIIIQKMCNVKSSLSKYIENALK